MHVDRRTRNGALIGAFAGPPLVLLGAYPLIGSHVAEATRDVTAGLWIPAVFVAFAAGVVGMPLLGASLGARAWVGRDLGRRLANHCIGGGMAGGLLAGLLLRGPARGWFDAGLPLRLVLMEAGLIVGVLLCFRGRTDPPPA